MFSNPILFSKRFNIVQSPNMTWSEKTKIRCKVNLHLGLGEILSWNQDNAPTLGKILHLYNRIDSSSPSGQEVGFYQIQKGHQMVNFHWERLKDYSIELKIGVQFYRNQERVRLIKKIKNNASSMDFKLSVFKQLLKVTPKTVRNKYGELLFSNARKKDCSKFRVGDYVQTTIGVGRKGVIIDKGYHLKDQCFIYQLLIKDKIYKSYYKENQLQLKENFYSIR